MPRRASASASKSKSPSPVSAVKFKPAKTPVSKKPKTPPAPKVPTPVSEGEDLDDEDYLDENIEDDFTDFLYVARFLRCALCALVDSKLRNTHFVAIGSSQLSL